MFRVRNLCEYLLSGQFSTHFNTRRKRPLHIPDAQVIRCLSSLVSKKSCQAEELTIQDKPNFEQINMINPLDEDDRTVVFKIIDTMLTKKKFKDFFNNNVAAL